MGFLGAEQFVDGSDPFYVNTATGTLILDKIGITFYEYDEQLEENICFEQETQLNDFSATFIVNSLETLNETEFNKWIETFKTHPKTRVEKF